jgi:hypothetical protein
LRRPEAKRSVVGSPAADPHPIDIESTLPAKNIWGEETIMQLGAFIRRSRAGVPGMPRAGRQRARCIAPSPWARFPVTPSNERTGGALTARRHRTSSANTHEETP